MKYLRSVYGIRTVVGRVFNGLSPAALTKQEVCYERKP
jgi:hypothetical protein